MSNLWWLQPGWTDAVCACGARIYPEGDPDWGRCFQCFSAELAHNQAMAEQEEQYWAEAEALYGVGFEVLNPAYDELGPLLSRGPRHD